MCAKRGSDAMSCPPFVFKGRQPPVLYFVHDAIDNLLSFLPSDNPRCVLMRIGQTGVFGIEILLQVDHDIIQTSRRRDRP